MPRVALALLLGLAPALACNAPAPAPATAPRTAAKPAPAPEKAPAKAPENTPPPAAKPPSHPLCDAAAGPLKALQTQDSATPIAYTNTTVQQWVAAGDAALGRKDDAAITASLKDSTPAGFHYTRTLIEAAIAQWMRDQLKRAAEGTEGREAAWSAAHCAWKVALEPLTAEVAGSDPGLVDQVDQAFAAGAAAFAAGDVAAIDRAVLPGHEVVEKSWFRLVHRRLIDAAETAKTANDPVAAARARGLFEALRDRLKDRNTPGIAIVDAALAVSPDKIDAEKVKREIALAIVKRARKYCDEALTPAAKGPLGSPASLATVAEGLAYTRIILPDMSQRLAKDKLDAAMHVQTWQAYGDAVEHADAAEATKLSADLVEWNCSYQRALGIRECTSSADEVSPPAP